MAFFTSQGVLAGPVGYYSLLGLGLLVVCYVVSAVRSWYRLRSVPGPWVATFSYAWLASVAASGRQGPFYRDLNKQYRSSLVRIGPNELTTDDPELLRRMAGARSAYGRDGWYLGAKFNPYHPNMFTMLDVREHDRAKAKTAGAYGGRETPTLEPGVDEQVATLLRVIREKYVVAVPAAGQGRLLDLAVMTSFFTMDVITKVAFGEEFGYMKTDEDLYGFLFSIRKFWPRLAMTVDVPWIRNMLFSNTFLRWFGPQPTDPIGMGRLMWVAKKVVDGRFGPDAEAQQDMLGAFIRHGLSQDECESEGLFMIIAGSETTASALRTAILHVITCPRVYNRLKREIADVVRAGRASTPITFEEARKVSYLQAIIYEGLRMRPPAAGLHPKSVPPQGDTIAGHFVPGGTAIGMNTASLTRLRAYFGDDADLFRPERFEEVDAAARAERERLVELVFGHGRWMCAGKPVAFMELNKALFELFRAFDFQLANPEEPWHSLSYSVFIEENMMVQVTDAKPAYV